jgi:hypothetical protein
MTSPMSGWLSGGPWRHGVAVISIVGRPGASSRVVCHGSSPRVVPPRRFEPEVVVMTTPPAGSSVRPAGSRLSPMVVVSEQDGVDRQEVGRGDGRSGELARPRAPTEVVPPTWGIERRIAQQPPAVELNQRSRPADVGDADVGHRGVRVTRR